MKNNADFKKGNKMRRRILSICYQLGWTEHIIMTDRTQVDFVRLDEWMLASSYLKKTMNEYKYAELPKLVTQFESVFKSYLNSK